jgi:predicted RNase H-like HicB family nuclease
VTTIYEATVIREDGWWMVHVPAINGLTQARRLAEAELMARELVAVTQDVELDTVAAIVTEVDGVPVRAVVDAVAAERAEAARLEAEATAKVSTLARTLAERHVSMRDIGAVLGVSHQRVHQLVAA